MTCDQHPNIDRTVFTAIPLGDDEYDIRALAPGSGEVAGRSPAFTALASVRAALLEAQN